MAAISVIRRQSRGEMVLFALHADPDGRYAGGTERHVRQLQQIVAEPGIDADVEAVPMPPLLAKLGRALDHVLGLPDLDLITYALPLTVCALCGEPGVHSSCVAALELEPPRYCMQCGRRMVVQVHPTGWSAKCVEHGSITS